MSDALNYLIKARPDAMTSYFKFLKEAGTRLICPKHHWAFDISTGECVEIGSRPLTKFKHKLDGDKFLAYW